MAYQVGDRVGDYEVTGILGKGGMGQVYKVRNVISQRVEAMKVLLPDLQNNADLAERFLREIKVQASLQHPHIAALHTAQRIDNQLMMIMEFVEGRSVDHLLAAGPLPADRAVLYIGQVLEALAYAHDRGVVHRDIKPANIMVTGDETAKLMDFGIARIAADPKLTQTGHTVGSLYYMSPEQINGVSDLDARADIYSLGVSFYEMVTGKRPFQGDSDYSIMAAHLAASPVPPIQIAPGLPPVLSDIILMAIARDPAGRFQTAGAFWNALNNLNSVATAPPLAAPAPVPAAREIRPIGRRGLYMAAGSLATILILVAAAFQAPRWMGPSSAAAPVLRNEAKSEPAPLVVLRNEPKPVSQPPILRNQPKPEYRAALQNEPKSVAPVPAPAPAPAPAPNLQNEPKAPVERADTESSEIEVLRERWNSLGSRVRSSLASVERLRKQQAGQGYGLRSDIAATVDRMGGRMDEAEAALRSGNAANLKKSLDLAERDLDRLEKFLGN